MSGDIAEDLALVRLCVDGKEDAAEKLVRKYSRLIFHAVQSTLHRHHIPFTREDAEDLFHTVFLHLFDNRGRKLHQYKGKNGCSLATWLRVVSVRIVLNELRKKQLFSLGTASKTISFEFLEQIGVSPEETEDKVELRDRYRLLEDAVKMLSSRYRLFYRLHFDQGLTLQETADAMNTTMQNIYTLKSRTIQQLKERIESLEN